MGRGIVLTIRIKAKLMQISDQRQRRRTLNLLQELVDLLMPPVEPGESPREGGEDYHDAKKAHFQRILLDKCLKRGNLRTGSVLYRCFQHATTEESLLFAEKTSRKYFYAWLNEDRPMPGRGPIKRDNDGILVAEQTKKDNNNCLVPEN